MDYIDGNIIYGLIDPNTNKIRYIGYSSNMKQRFYDHCIPYNLKKKTHKNNWLRPIIESGQKPIIIVLDRFDNSNDLPKAEVATVALYRSMGYDLVNGTDGGDGFQKGHKISAETKYKLSIASTGRKHTEETKQKIREVNIGKTLSIETKYKISESQKGEKNHNFGKPKSEETKQKLSKSKNGKYTGENSFNFGKKHTKEHIDNKVKNDPRRKFIAKDVKDIKDLYETKKYTQKDLAKLYNTSQSYISDILLGKSGKHLP